MTRDNSPYQASKTLAMKGDTLTNPEIRTGASWGENGAEVQRSSVLVYYSPHLCSSGTFYTSCDLSIQKVTSLSRQGQRSTVFVLVHSTPPTYTHSTWGPFQE
jgi:hypothetical protein